MSELEIVDFSLKGGRIVQCAKRGQVVIQLNRVMIYGYGRVKFPEREARWFVAISKLQMDG